MMTQSQMCRVLTFMTLTMVAGCALGTEVLYVIGCLNKVSMVQGQQDSSLGRLNIKNYVGTYFKCCCYWKFWKQDDMSRSRSRSSLMHTVLAHL